MKLLNTCWLMFFSAGSCFAAFNLSSIQGEVSVVSRLQPIGETYASEHVATSDAKRGFRRASGGVAEFPGGAGSESGGFADIAAVEGSYARLKASCFTHTHIYNPVFDGFANASAEISAKLSFQKPTLIRIELRSTHHTRFGAFPMPAQSSLSLSGPATDYRLDVEWPAGPSQETEYQNWETRKQARAFFLQPGTYLLSNASAATSSSLVLRNGNNNEIASYLTISEGGISVVYDQSGSPVSEAGTVLISGTNPPLMPYLRVALELPEGASGVVTWHVSSSYPRRKGADDFKLDFQLPLGQAWYFPTNAFYGGDIQISAGTEEFPEQTFSFHIRGENPDPATAKQFIISHAGEHRFAWAIARHESRPGGKPFFNQFYRKGARTGEPVFGPPDGWGMCQIDSARGFPFGKIPVTTDQVWNWQTNVLTAIEVLNESKVKAQQYFDFLRAVYEPQGLWVEPPSDFVPTRTTTHMTALEAATITLYNGGAIPTRLWVKDGAIVRKGGTNAPPRLAKTDQLNSCWSFNPNAPVGQKWTCLPNGNNYLFKVIHDENERPE